MGDVDLQDMVRGYEHKVGIRWDPPTPDPTILVPIELRAHLQDGRPEPEYQIRLCFGEAWVGKIPWRREWQPTPVFLPGQEYTEELYKKDLHDPDNHNRMLTYLEPDVLEWPKVEQGPPWPSLAQPGPMAPPLCPAGLLQALFLPTPPLTPGPPCCPWTQK